jgi:hypothetical protein
MWLTPGFLASDWSTRRTSFGVSSVPHAVEVGGRLDLGARELQRREGYSRRTETPPNDPTQLVAPQLSGIAKEGLDLGDGDLIVKYARLDRIGRSGHIGGG